MAIKLKENGRLVYAGEAVLHAPDGSALPAVPQYMIVPADEADPAAVVELQDNEWLVYGGRVFNDMKLARERFAAIKAGKEPPPREEGIPIYFIEDIANIDPKTGRTYESEKVIKALSDIFTELYFMQIRKEKAAERQVELRNNNIPPKRQDKF